MILTAMGVSAQNLTKEIVVDKEIILEQRDVTPLSVQPRLVVDPLSPVSLPWSRTAVATQPTVGIDTLPPAAWRLGIDQSPWRGYVRGGYFPALQADVSAGYRVIRRDNMRLDVWGQYKALGYKNRLVDKNDRLNNNDMTIGADYRWMPLKDAQLTAAVNYLGSVYTMPRYFTSPTDGIEDCGFNQTVSDFNIRLGWSQQLARVDYAASLALGHFEFGHGSYYGAEDKGDRFKAMYQTTLDAKAHVAGKISDLLSARMGLQYQGAFNPGGYMLAGNRTGVLLPSTDYGVLTLSPSVTATRDNFRIRLGLNAYVRTGEVSKFNIYPDARIDWLPTQQFSVYAAVGGGRVDLNTFSGLFSRMRYLNPSTVFTPASSKMTFDAGVTIGPFHGFSIDVTASAANWSGVVMPIAADLMEIGLTEPAHIKALHGGATLRYEYRDIVKVLARYTIASHGRENGCVDWMDRATDVLDTRLDVTPVKALTISAGYGMRTGRHIYTTEGTRLSLSPARDLFLSAIYRLNDRVSIEAEAHNLTASRWQVTYGVTNPGVTGFLGATYRF